MKRRARILLLIAAAAFLSFKLATRPADPIFRGRHVSAWVAEFFERGSQTARSFPRIIDIGSPAAAHLAKYLPLRGSDQQWLPAIVTKYLRVDSQQSQNQRNAALAALAELGPQGADALPALIKLLGESSDETAAEANHVLRRIGPASAAALRRALRNAPELARARAAQSLHDFGDSAENIRALEQALRDRSPVVRANAAESLGIFRKGEDALARLLSDEVSAPRAKACEAMGKIGSRRSLAALTERLFDSDPTVRFEAARALWKIDRDARQALRVFVQLLKSSEGWRAAHALGEMREEAAPAIPALLRAMRREQVPRPFRSPPSVAFALGQIPSAAPALAELLSDGQPSVRVSAALALGFMGQGAAPAEPRLLSVLTDSNADVRIASALTLGALGSRDARTISALEEGLRAEDIFLRSRSAELLRKLAPDREWFAATE